MYIWTLTTKTLASVLFWEMTPQIDCENQLPGEHEQCAVLLVNNKLPEASGHHATDGETCLGGRRLLYFWLVMSSDISRSSAIIMSQNGTERHNDQLKVNDRQKKGLADPSPSALLGSVVKKVSMCNHY
jgi:hypothetical protein